jgi:hypothetical protein
MEIVPVIAMAMATTCAAVVCVWRTMLGRRMDRSFEVTKSHPRSIPSTRIDPIAGFRSDGGRFRARQADTVSPEPRSSSDAWLAH